MKHISNTILSQVPQKPKESYNPPIPALNAQLVKNLPEEMIKLRLLSKDTANLLLGIGIRYGKIYPSQISIANHFGKRRETVNRVVAKLKKIGFIIETQSRGFKNSLEYTLNPTIFLRPNLERLQSHFPALNKLLLYLCLVSPIATYGNKVTQLIKEDIKNKNYFIIAPSDKGKTMPLSHTANVIQQLPFQLDTSQKVFLLGFPHEALEYATDKLLLATGTLRSPWRFFLKQAFEYNKREGIRFKHALVVELLNKRKIREVNFQSAQFVPKRHELEPVTKPHELQKRESRSSVSQSQALPKLRPLRSNKHQELTDRIARCYVNIDKLKMQELDPFFMATENDRAMLIRRVEHEKEGYQKELEQL